MLFSDFISNFKAGRINDKVSQEMIKLTRAAELHNKPAELILKVKIRPAKQRGEASLQVTYQSKEPKYDTMEGTMFITEDGTMSFDDPQQAEMFTTGGFNPKTGEVFTSNSKDLAIVR
jgi:hypothetical protein